MLEALALPAVESTPLALAPEVMSGKTALARILVQTKIMVFIMTYIVATVKLLASVLQV